MYKYVQKVVMENETMLKGHILNKRFFLIKNIK